MKTAQAFHLYTLGQLDPARLPQVLADPRLEAEALTDPAKVVDPALILAGPGQHAPEGMADITISPPAGASQSVLRELLRVAMGDISLKYQAKELQQSARRLAPRFEAV